jgi:hypothetical protein
MWLILQDHAGYDEPDREKNGSNEHEQRNDAGDIEDGFKHDNNSSVMVSTVERIAFETIDTGRQWRPARPFLISDRVT